MKPRQLKSGAWNVRIMIEGQSYSFTHIDKKTVIRMAAEFADEHRRRIENPTLLEAMRDYVAENEERLSPSTIRGYSGMFRMIEQRTPKIAAKKVSTLSNKDINEIVRPLRTLKTKRNYLNFIQASTGRQFNVRLSGQASKEMNVPTELEVDGLLQIFHNTELEIPIMLAAYGGLRRGEICALTLDDVVGDYVIITKDKVRDDLGQWIVKPPKTKSSIRRVLLPHFVIELIHERGHITTLTPYRVSDKFRKKQERLGIKPYCFHSLRHFNASFLHTAGIPDAYILARGGWATPHVMTKVYRHALADHIDPMDIKAVKSFHIPFQN